MKVEREQLLVGFCEFLEHAIPEDIGKEKNSKEEQDDGKFCLSFNPNFLSSLNSSDLDMSYTLLSFSQLLSCLNQAYEILFDRILSTCCWQHFRNLLQILPNICLDLNYKKAYRRLFFRTLVRNST